MPKQDHTLSVSLRPGADRQSHAGSLLVLPVPLHGTQNSWCISTPAASCLGSSCTLQHTNITQSFITPSFVAPSFVAPSFDTPSFVASSFVTLTHDFTWEGLWLDPLSTYFD